MFTNEELSRRLSLGFPAIQNMSFTDRVNRVLAAHDFISTLLHENKITVEQFFSARIDFDSTETPAVLQFVADNKEALKQIVFDEIGVKLNY